METKKVKKTEMRHQIEMETINFVSLKFLQLDNVSGMECDDVSNLVERCVNLEILKLMYIEFDSPGVLRIYSDTIKKLYLTLCWTEISLDFDICCPSLKKIESCVLHFGNCVIKDITLLEEASLCLSSLDYGKSWESMLSFFSGISSLNVWDKLLESNEVPAGCERFASNLKHLKVEFAYNNNDLVGLAALLKLIPKLETLELSNIGTNEANLHQDYLQASTVFNMPCLREVVLRNYSKSKCEHHFIKLFKKCGIALEKIILIDGSKSYSTSVSSLVDEVDLCT